MSGLDAGLVGTLYHAACLAELDALKPGNVHAYAEGHRMLVADFLTSADVSAPALARPRTGVGERVRAGVAATMAAVAQNTNLGILLLCAPLAAAAERGSTVESVLGSLDRADSEAVFAAIRLANPGGLGRAGQYDVAAAAPESLLAAMAEASDRDRIARAYVTGFADVTTIGLAALAEARAQGLDRSWCTTAIHLSYLRAAPDSHIARKAGVATAEAVRREAEETLADLDLASRPVDPLLALDASLKARGLNPGTSADFTVATLFWDALASAGAVLA
ncbi:triphosphoribosyl-dephospho-CoA synthase [Methylobacterium sp. NEAU K]|uniref:triphosphoribosyl-dephospho-CoA synthase n=1 Tax=Methylobacterium sp. NEAU K TaxID=3064946 RepID=UPI002735D2E6|nr:triphosphoribosyl-dephospho-CoA synthase [Methylobacterium sp. NEAU K]MDP4002521.1 triphosphoribosyl-dephospho-CoA synthase [Methylobacterium sp. NEAU K]